MCNNVTLCILLRCEKTTELLKHNLLEKKKFIYTSISYQIRSNSEQFIHFLLLKRSTQLNQQNLQLIYGCNVMDESLYLCLGRVLAYQYASVGMFTSMFELQISS